MHINKPEKEKRRFFAISSLGKNRWYWVVWPSLDGIRASNEPLLQVGEGYEKTKSDAVDKALEMAGKYAEWIAAKYARIYHRNKTSVKRRRLILVLLSALTLPNCMNFYIEMSTIRRASGGFQCRIEL